MGSFEITLKTMVCWPLYKTTILGIIHLAKFCISDELNGFYFIAGEITEIWSSPTC